MIHFPYVLIASFAQFDDQIEYFFNIINRVSELYKYSKKNPWNLRSVVLIKHLSKPQLLTQLIKNTPSSSSRNNNKPNTTTTTHLLTHDSFQLSGALEVWLETWNLIIINVEKGNTMTPNFDAINQTPWHVSRRQHSLVCCQCWCKTVSPVLLYYRWPTCYKCQL